MKRENKKNRRRIKGIQPDIRYLKDMEEVVCDKNFAKKHPSLELYYMYRGIDRIDDLRYDITIMPSQMLGEEFVKTKGHSHLNEMQELYTVLEGEAIFLMQKGKPSFAEASEGKGEIEDVFVVKAKKGEWIIVPPGYAHITINPSKKELKMANWIYEGCKSFYEDIRKMQGACYYFTQSGWIKNKNYKKIPPLRFEKPLKEKPKNLDFLKEKR